MGRLIKGRIEYSQNHGDKKREIGRENFSMSIGHDGRRTLRAVCEMYEERILRDVVYTVDKHFLPIEAYVRVAYGSDVGSGWFRFTDSYAAGESHTAEDGRISQHIPLTSPIRAFGSHPICSDIWRLSQLKKENIGESQHLTNCMNSSSLLDGASGPTLAKSQYLYSYEGAETITVEAGTFDCHRFDWKLRDNMTLKMWTTDDDYLPICMVIPKTGNTYELTDLAFHEGEL